MVAAEAVTVEDVVAIAVMAVGPGVVAAGAMIRMEAVAIRVVAGQMEVDSGHALTPTEEEAVVDLGTAVAVVDPAADSDLAVVAEGAAVEDMTRMEAEAVDMAVAEAEMTVVADLGPAVRLWAGDGFKGECSKGEEVWRVQANLYYF